MYYEVKLISDWVRLSLAANIAFGSMLARDKQRKHVLRCWTGSQLTIKSLVWKTFGIEQREGKLGKSLVVCEVCETAIKFTGSMIVTGTWREGMMKCMWTARSNYVDASNFYKQ